MTKANLFVIHSQAQLILAVGLVKGRFIDDQNHLILFKDFLISEEMKISLTSIFEKIIFRTGTYPSLNKSWKAKLIRYPNDIKSINELMIAPYDKVFEVCDGNLPEIYILKRAYQLNKSVEMIWLEDGSYPYYLNFIDLDGLNSNAFARYIRKLIFKYLFRLGNFYKFDGNHMGANINITKAYLTLKGNERDIFSSKEIVQITKSEYYLGIKTLFDVRDVPINDDAIILVLDKLDVYANISDIKTLVINLIKMAKGRYELFYKFHPREEGELKELNPFNPIDKNIGIEYYYSALAGKNIIVVGVKSTGLQSAKILGFKTISAAILVKEADDNVVEFYEKIGIDVPKSYNDLLTLLEI